MGIMLSNGKELVADLTKISIREFRKLKRDDQPQEEEDATLAKAFGITVDELLELSQPDYRRAVEEFMRAAMQPLNDPKV